MVSFFKNCLLPICLWIVLTPWLNEWDLALSHFFYEEGHFSLHPFWDWVYYYGLWPAWIVVLGALMGAFLSLYPSYSSWRRPALFLFLVFILGPGLIIHAGFKDHWGRPRPRQIENFGGKQSFRPYYQPNFGPQPEPSKSFTCGHCSLGFYFFALVLIGKAYQLRHLYWLGIGMTWGLGGLLSLTRIAQGGHFLSDTIASALIMWLITWGLASFLLFEKKVTPMSSSLFRKKPYKPLNPQYEQHIPSHYHTRRRS